MTDLTVKELNKEHIWLANSHSMSGTRGDHSDFEYHQYANKILSCSISCTINGPLCCHTRRSTCL